MTTKVGCYRDKRNKYRPWVVRWFGEYDPKTERQKGYYENFATKREAERFQTAKQAELNRGGQRDRLDDITVADFAERFMATKAKGKRASTSCGYRRTFDRLVQECGPTTPLLRITAEWADRFIAGLDRVSESGRGYSPATRNQQLRNCKAAFRVAVEWGYLLRNPFGHIRQQRVPGQPWHHLKPAEFNAVIDVVTALRWRALYFLAYTTGGRFGELFNLTWADVDFDRGSVRIQDHASTATMPPFQVKDYEARHLLLPRSTIDALLAWQGEAPEGVPYILLTADRYRRVQERWALCRAGKPWKRVRSTGALEWAEWANCYMVNNVVRDIRAHVRRAGVQVTAPLALHTLRKSFAQNHANSGTPIHVLQRLMGHASITTTRQYYLQQSDENERAATDRYEALIRGATAVQLLYEPAKRPAGDAQPHPTSSPSPESRTPYRN